MVVMSEMSGKSDKSDKARKAFVKIVKAQAELRKLANKDKPDVKQVKNQLEKVKAAIPDLKGDPELQESYPVFQQFFDEVYELLGDKLDSKSRPKFE